MSNRFDGKVVLITGAASGLGQAAALQVAKEGAKLSLVDLNSGALEETKSKITEVAPNAEVLLITANVADEKAVESYVNETVESLAESMDSSTMPESKGSKTQPRIMASRSSRRLSTST